MPVFKTVFVLISLTTIFVLAFAQAPQPSAREEVRLITLDPGHFHASLVHKEMYPGVSKKVHVYAPLGPDLLEHLGRISRFNLRPDNPTSWELEVHTGPDFLQRMLKERPGNVVVLAGRNRGKVDYIKTSVDAGLNVLSDKPWIIRAEDFPKLESVLNTAPAKGLVAYDLMTERYEVTTMLQKELVNDPAIFGSIKQGTEKDPGVYMESVHRVLKLVAGAPNLRPAWFFDVLQQGEGLTDVGTHLVDLVPWTLFPEQPIDYRKDVRVVAGKREPIVMTRDEFARVTGEPGFPAFLAPNIKDGKLEYYCNTYVSYVLRGVNVKLDVLWTYDAPPGAGDTHHAEYRGTRSLVEVLQGKEQKYRPELYVVPNNASDKPQILAVLKKKAESLQGKYPGIGVEDDGARIWVTVPDKLRLGHEYHFAQVTSRFLEYLKNPKALPAWEKANMLAKYYVTTKGVELAHQK